MEEFLSITLDKKLKVPVYRQLGDALSGLVYQKILPPHTKLPPIRKMAEALRVNMVTVVNAYKYLENNRVVYSVLGSGTYVAEVFDKEVVAVKNKPVVPIENAIHFERNAMPADFFPVEPFREAMNLVLEKEGSRAFGEVDRQGYEPLQQKIMDWGRYSAATNEIQIVSSLRQARDLVFRTLLRPNDVVLVENPFYHDFIGVLLAMGVRVMTVDLQSDGADMGQVESLAKMYKPKLICISSCLQNPTGVCYSDENKKALMALANQWGMYILDEENPCDFCFAQTTLTKDEFGVVISIGGFAKIMGSGFDLGYLVYPKGKLGLVPSGSDGSGFMQKALVRFMDSGGYDAHIKMVRQRLAKRYTLFYDEVEQKAGEYLKFVKPCGGIYAWLEIRDREISAAELCNRLVAENVVAVPGMYYSLINEDLPFVGLCFGFVDEEQIIEGIAALLDVFRQWENAE